MENAHAQVGKRKWNHRVEEVLAQIQPTFNLREIYRGGGNAKHITFDLSGNVQLTPKVEGLRAGAALRQDLAHRKTRLAQNARRERRANAPRVPASDLGSSPQARRVR